MDKKELLKELQSLTQKKNTFEGRLNELQNALNLTRDEFMKTLGAIDIVTSLLSKMDKEMAEEAIEVIKPNLREQLPKTKKEA